MYIQYFKLLLTFIMHSATIKYFKTLELIHFQIKIPKRGKPKPRRGECRPPERNPAVCNYGTMNASMNPVLSLKLKLYATL